MWEELINAITNGNTNEAITLISQMNSEDFQRDTTGLSYKEIPLHFAASKGYKNIVDLILEKNPGLINSVDKDGYNTLYIAAALGQTEFVKYLINQEDIDIGAKNNNGSNLLHAAAYNHEVEVLKVIFDKYKYKDKEILSNLMNQRDNSGTVPLGKAFLKQKATNDQIASVAKLFIEQRDFDINAYLNNKEGMNSLTTHPSKAIGGLNILHMALIKNIPEILDFLVERNDNLGWKNSAGYSCNFMYPTLNPLYHMWSPTKFLSSYNNNDDLILKYHTHKDKQVSKEEDDESGDSDDEGSSAYVWKHVLMDMVYSEAMEKIENHYSMPLFHGMPFMSGLYRHLDRKYVGETLMLLNQGLSEKTQNEIKDQLIGIASDKDENLKQKLLRVQDDKEAQRELVKPDEGLRAVHSRTSTANVGMESLVQIVKAGADGLGTLNAEDNELKQLLKQAHDLDKTVFQSQIVNFVNKYTDLDGSTQREVWGGLLSLVPEFKDQVKYRFPFLSTSKTPFHANKFGFGIGLEANRGEGKMEPMYNYDPNCPGKPKHKLAGLMYIIKEDDDILAKLEAGELFDICSLNGVNTRYKNQIEIAYLANIDKDKVVAIIPLIYPNFSKDFDPGYHGTVLGFSKTKYNKLANQMKNLGNIDTIILVEENGDNASSPTTIGAKLANIFVPLAETIASKFFGTKLCTVLDGDIVEYDSSNYEFTTRNFTSPTHKMLIKSKANGTPPSKVITRKQDPNENLPNQLVFDKVDSDEDILFADLEASDINLIDGFMNMTISGNVNTLPENDDQD